MSDERLSDLLLLWEERQEQSESVCAEQLCADAPHLLDELQRRIDALRRVNAVLDTCGCEVSDDCASTPVDYGGAQPNGGFSADEITARVIYHAPRYHARGGRGEVYVAEEVSMQREVALKFIQPAHADDDLHRRRFIQEARITGRLQHPGIVPVYGAGEFEGCPFYAMRMIDGDTLAKAVRDLHKSKREPGDGAAKWTLTQLLDRFVQVCNTVAYAHSRGVMHRDLKPENILLGTFGETLVADWGLAKRTHDTGLDGSNSAAESDRDAIQTCEGATLGTPAYLSPEQAAGDTSVGPASDIFALGATLYTILAGRPPYRGNSSFDVVRLAKAAKFPPPRQLNPDIPRPLEAICLKAMSENPNDRYATALELAQDIEGWQADDPITAWRDTLIDRLGRWSRKNRTWAGAVTAALLLVTIVSLMALAAIDRQRRITAQTQEEAIELRDLALDQVHRVAFQATNEMAAHPGLRRARLNLVTESVAALDRIPAAHRTRRSQEMTANARRRLGVLLLNLSDDDGLAQAREEYEAAHRLFEKLAADRPDQTSRLALGESFRNLGRISHQAGEHEAAQRHALRSLETLAALHAGDPNSHRAILGQAQAYVLLAEVSGTLDDRQAALAAYHSALKLTDELLARDPSHGAARQQRGLILTRQGQLHLRKDPDVARRYCESARFDAERLLAELPNDLSGQLLLANALRGLGAIYLKSGDAESALATSQQSVDLVESLAADHADNLLVLSALPHAYKQLADVQAAIDRANDARDYYQRALNIYATLADDAPDRGTRHMDLLRLYATLGGFERKQGNVDQAMDYTEQALRVAEEYGTARQAAASRDLLPLLNRLSVTHLLAGELQQSAKLCRRGLQILAERKAAGRLDAKQTMYVQRFEARIESCAVLHAMPPEERRRVVDRRAVARSAVHKAKAGDLQRAGELIDLLLAAVDDDSEASEEFLIRSARYLARQTTLLADKPASALRDEVRRFYVSRAIDILSHLIEDGWSDLDQLQTDSEFDPLRDETRFQQLTERLRREPTIAE